MQRLLANQHGMAGILIAVLVLVGVIVVVVVGTAAVILPNPLTITVKNMSCGTLDVAKGTAALRLNFLPAFNIPSEIAQGETAEVQIPRRFVDEVTLSSGTVYIRAFSRSFTFGTSKVDPQRSTWDGQPLANLAGRPLNLAGSHTLILECR